MVHWAFRDTGGKLCSSLHGTVAKTKEEVACSTCLQKIKTWEQIAKKYKPWNWSEERSVK